MKATLLILTAIAMLAASTGTARAQTSDYGTIRIGHGVAEPGAEVTVTLEGVDLPPESLRAWAIDVGFDPDVARARECASLQGGVCNAQFDAGIVRVTGASPEGLVGTASLAEVTFECGPEEGRTDLTLEEVPFGPADPGAAGAAFPDLQVGSIACQAEASPTAEPPHTNTPQIVLPDTGGGGAPSVNTRPWVATLAALGLTGLAGACLLLHRNI